MSVADVKWTNISVPRVGDVYYVFYSNGGFALHARKRGGGIAVVRFGWAIRRDRKRNHRRGDKR